MNFWSFSKNTARESVLLESIFLIFLSTFLEELAWDQEEENEAVLLHTKSSPGELSAFLLFRPLGVNMAGLVW